MGAWHPESGSFDRDLELCTTQNGPYFCLFVLLSLLPFWLRLMQCCRGFRDSRAPKHLANGFKYCTSMAVVLLSFAKDPAHPGIIDTVWAATAVFSTAL